jgi:hypothetical protein
MAEFVAVRDVESDLRQIIIEASSRKNLPHVRDRAERAVASILMINDHASLLRAVEEVLSALLIATEVGLSPHLIICSLTILQKLAATISVKAETFLHMITVLCKSASSLCAVLCASSINASLQTDIEVAQLRCLQTLHLLQVNELGGFFLDEVVLSQIVTMCVNLINHQFSSRVVVQSAQGAISQLYLFVIEVSSSIGTDVETSLSDSTDSNRGFNSGGELQGVYDQGSVLIGDPRQKPLFMFTHDLVTMSSPRFSRQIACSLFGSGRLSAPLAIEMLSSFFNPRRTNLGPAQLLVASDYLLPLISRTTADYLGGPETRTNGTVSVVSLVHFRLLMKLLVNIVNMDPPFRHLDTGLNTIFIQLHNFLVEEPGFGDPFNRMLITEICTQCIARNSRVVGGSQPAQVSNPATPFGGDSPIKHRVSSGGIADSVLESVCMHIHSLSPALIHLQCSSKLSILFSSIEFTKEIPEVDQANSSLEFVLTLIDTAFSQSVLAESVEHTWASILSCLLLVLSNTATAPPMNVLNGTEKLFIMLARADHKEGMHACIQGILKLHGSPAINKFVLNMFHRLSEEAIVLTNIGSDQWRLILKQFEIISTSQKGMSPDDLTVQTIALDTFFSSPASTKAVDTLVTALTMDLSAISAWTFHRLSQILTSEKASADHVDSLWSSHVETVFKSHSVLGFVLVQALVTRFPETPVPQKILKCVADVSESFPQQTTGCLLNVVESCGYLLSDSAWSHIVSSVFACSLNSNETKVFTQILRIVELAIDDITPSIVPHIPKLVDVLTTTTLGPNSEVLPLTCAFKAVGLALKASEHMAKDGWESVLKFFTAACTDKRADVRNCALRTISGVSFPDSPESVLRTAILVVSLAREAKHILSPTPTVAIVHHSRDTEEKRWSESVVLALGAWAQTVVKKRSKTLECPDLVTELIDSVLADGSSDEILLAACKSISDVWKSLSYGPCDVFTSIVVKETTRVRESGTVSKLSTLLLPALLGGMKRLVPEVENVVFEYLAAISTCPMVHAEIAVPFTSSAPLPSSRLWYSKHWSIAEAEPFNCIIKWDLEENIYHSVIEESVRVPNYLNTVLSHLSVFGEEHLISLFLDPETVFLNSLSLLMAVKAMHALVPSSSPRVVEALEKLARTRNTSIGIASTGVWKLCMQALFLRGETIVLLRLLDQVSGDPIDVTDHMHVLHCVNCTHDKSLLYEFVQTQLSMEPNNFRTFVFFIILIACTTDPSEQTSIHNGLLYTMATRRSDDGLVDSLPKMIGGGQKFLDATPVSPILVAYMRAILQNFNNEESTACACMHMLLLASNTELRKKFVAETWDILVGQLIPSDSQRLRLAVSQLLLAVGYQI